MANKVAIVTDTTACIPREQVEQYAIELVPIDVIFGDKVYRDGIDITPAEFYALLKQADTLPTTSGSLPGPFVEAYRKASQRASSILCITISAKFSGMFNSAQLAIEMTKEDLTGVVIEVLECTTAAVGQGLVVLAAAKAAASGKNLAEVVDTARSVMQRVNLFATLDTLHYLVKGGRVPKAAALASSLLKIKPIFTVSDGEAHPVTNVRTNPGAMKRLLKIMGQKVVKGQPLHAAVMHADALDRAIAFRNQISSRFDCAELFITEFTPVMGVHTGPGVIGVAFYSGD
ncbi:MAG: DegV family protein [Chloroflexi bacterium]|nr:DegV family protein [Chloroflexota bacterium]